jgi:hypothetical protein
VREVPTHARARAREIRNRDTANETCERGEAVAQEAMRPMNRLRYPL